MHSKSAKPSHQKTNNEKFPSVEQEVDDTEKANEDPFLSKMESVNRILRAMQEEYMKQKRLVALKDIEIMQMKRTNDFLLSLLEEAEKSKEYLRKQYGEFGEIDKGVFRGEVVVFGNKKMKQKTEAKFSFKSTHVQGLYLEIAMGPESGEDTSKTTNKRANVIILKEINELSSQKKTFEIRTDKGTLFKFSIRRAGIFEQLLMSKIDLVNTRRNAAGVQNDWESDDEENESDGESSAIELVVEMEESVPKAEKVVNRKSSLRVGMFEIPKHEKRRIAEIQSKLLREKGSVLQREMERVRSELGDKDAEIVELNKKIASLESKVEKREVMAPNRNRNNIESMPIGRIKRGGRRNRRKYSFSRCSDEDFELIFKSKVFSSGHEYQKDIAEEEKRNLEVQEQKLKMLNTVITDSKNLSFVYGDSSKDVNIRGFLGFVIKQVAKEEASMNEVRFFEEVFNIAKEPIPIPSRFFERPGPVPASVKMYIPKYFGHWESRNARTHEVFLNIAMEKGDSNLQNFVLHDSDVMLSFANKLELVIELVKAVDLVFHSNGLVHRDLKPENAVVFRKKFERGMEQSDEETFFRLLDFECVQRAGKEPITSLTGTYNYIDPLLVPYLHSSEKKIDPYSLSRDVYSLASIITFVIFECIPYDEFIRFVNAKIDNFLDRNTLPKILYRLIVDKTDVKLASEGNTVELLAEMKRIAKISNDSESEHKKMALEYLKRIQLCRKKKSFYFLLEPAAQMEKIPMRVRKLLIDCMSIDERKRPGVKLMIKVLEECMEEVNKEGEGV